MFKAILIPYDMYTKVDEQQENELDSEEDED